MSAHESSSRNGQPSRLALTYGVLNPSAPSKGQLLLTDALVFASPVFASGRFAGFRLTGFRLALAPVFASPVFASLGIKSETFLTEKFFFESR